MYRVRKTYLSSSLLKPSLCGGGCIAEESKISPGGHGAHPSTSARVTSSITNVDAKVPAKHDRVGESGPGQSSCGAHSSHGPWLRSTRVSGFSCPEVRVEEEQWISTDPSLMRKGHAIKSFPLSRVLCISGQKRRLTHTCSMDRASNVRVHRSGDGVCSESSGDGIAPTRSR